jgi:SAM-dependent methyltransferase
VARLHLMESGLSVDYRLVSAETLAREAPGRFDAVACMELLEHVPDPAATVRACGELVGSGGHVFFATINRNLKAYLLAVVGAEYVLTCCRAARTTTPGSSSLGACGNVPARGSIRNGSDRHDLQPRHARLRAGTGYGRELPLARRKGVIGES